MALNSSKSLLAAVFWRMGLTMLLAIALVSCLLYYEFTEHVDNMRDRSLIGQATDIVRHLVVEPSGSVILNLPSSLQAVYNQINGEPSRYVVFDSNHNVLAASPGVDAPLFEDSAAPNHDWRYYQAIDQITGANSYGVGITAELPSHSVTVQVMQSAKHYDVLVETLIDESLDEYLWVVFLAFGAILAVTFFTLRSALRPLTLVSNQAAAIGPSSLERRLDATSLPTEIRPLVNAVNTALDRVESGFRIQRRFTADAAHEMRTPIAILRSHLTTIDPGHAHAVRADLDNLERVVAQLLKMAQIDALEVGPDQRADLHQVACLVAEYLAPKAVSDGMSIAIEGAEEAVVVGNPDALEVALRNLVENALACTADGSEVIIKIGTNPPEFSVLDQGPGISNEDKTHLFDRFWRKERSKEGGAGLGLSIVSRTCAAHDAQIAVEERPGGGSVFRVTFSAP